MIARSPRRLPLFITTESIVRVLDALEAIRVRVRRARRVLTHSETARGQAAHRDVYECERLVAAAAAAIEGRP